MSKLKSIAGSKVQFSLEVDQAALDKARKTVIQRAKSQVDLKGFRKGQAPDEMVLASVGAERIAMESINQAVEDQYRDFVINEQVAVINAPEVEFPKKADKMPMKIEVKVEVFPEVKMGAYQKLKLKKTDVKVEDAEIDDVLKTICSQMQLAEPVDRAAKNEDLVKVDFAGKDEKGEVLPSTAGQDHTFRLGMGQFLEDLEKAFIGMKAGESKEAVKVKFPKEYHAPDFAGKTIPFDITLHEVQEIDPSKMTEEQIEQVSGKKQSMKELRDQITQTVSANKSQAENQKHMVEYNDSLAKIVKVDLPQSWIDKEVETRLQRMKSSPQFQQDPEAFWKQMGADEEKMKKQFVVEGEKDLKVFLGLSEIVKLEKIELDKDEMEQAHQMAHQGLSNADDHSSPDHDAAMQRSVMQLKIDKYLRNLAA